MASHTSQPKGGRFQAPPNGKSRRLDLNQHVHIAHQILMVSTVGDDPTSLRANARLRRLPIPPRRDKKIQDLFAIRLWTSRVLSEVASHHSCKFDSIKPRVRTIFAL